MTARDGIGTSWVWLNQLLNCNSWRHLGHYEYWTVTQKWINFLNCNFGTLRFWITFLGLECFYGHSNSKMSNQKTKHILILLLRISDCKDKDKKWSSWIPSHHLQNRSFWQHRGINLWIIIGHWSLWTLDRNIGESPSNCNFWQD